MNVSAISKSFFLNKIKSELGLNVPDDVSVRGYDDVPNAAWKAYDLTTIRQPANRMVAETVEILLTKINDAGADPRRVEIDGPLIVRGSARIPEGWK